MLVDAACCLISTRYRYMNAYRCEFWSLKSQSTYRICGTSVIRLSSRHIYTKVKTLVYMKPFDIEMQSHQYKKRQAHKSRSNSEHKWFLCSLLMWISLPAYTLSHINHAPNQTNKQQHHQQQQQQKSKTKNTWTYKRNLKCEWSKRIKTDERWVQVKGKRFYTYEKR